MYLYKTYHKIIEELKVYNTCNGFTLLIFRNKVELPISLFIIKPMKYFNGKKTDLQMPHRKPNRTTMAANNLCTKKTHQKTPFYYYKPFLLKVDLF